MKTLIKATYTLLVAAVGMAFTACTNEYEYEGATASGYQVYFRNDLASSVETSADVNSFTVEVNRIKTEGEITVPVTVTSDEGCIYTPAASTVTFADGDSIAKLTFTYDPADLVYGTYYNINVTINGDEYSTPYGLSTYSFSAGKTEWITMSENGGYGVFRDGCLSYFYGIDAMSWNVKIQESAVTPRRYRIVSPYGAGTDFYNTYVDGSTFSWGNLSEDQTSIIIDATDPDYVVIEGFYPGVVDPDGDMLYEFGYAYYYMTKDGYTKEILKNYGIPAGTLENGIITFPSTALIANTTGDFTLSYYGSDGTLALALPGYAITDYTASFSYTGRFTDTANKDYAMGEITFGDDVASAKYTVVSSSEDIDAVAAGIVDGSVEATNIDAAGDIKVELTESGKYTIVIVTYDAEGNAKGYYTYEFTFKSSSDNSAASWTPLYVGTFTYNWYPDFITNNSGEMAGGIYSGDDEVTVYGDESNPGTYKVAPWANNEEGLVFTMDEETADITFSYVETGDTEDSYGAIYASDAHTIYPDYFADATSYYSAGAFYFGTIYHVEAGNLGGSTERLVLTGQAEAAAATKAKAHTGMLKKARTFKATQLFNTKRQLKKVTPKL